MLLNNTEAQVLNLYNEGILLEDIHKTLNLPIKAIVDIVFKAKNTDKTSKYLNKYKYFGLFYLEGMTVENILLSSSITKEDFIQCISEIVKMDTVPNDIKNGVIDKLGKEFNISEKEATELLGLTYKKTFGSIIRKAWR